MSPDVKRKHAMPAARLLAAWVLYSFMLHLVWEVLQLPLYTLAEEASAGMVAWAVLHCTGGDALIALGTYLLTTAFLGLAWPWRAPLRGLPILLIGGVAYTFFSEWFNVYRVRSWSYADSMPTVLGIGVSPLLQWIVVPSLALWLLRSQVDPAGRERDPGHHG